MVKNEVEAVMVDQNRPYETLTKLEKLAVDEHGGNLTETISTLLYHTDGGLDLYVDGMTREEALITFRLMKQGAIEHYTEEGYSVALELEEKLGNLNISEEDLMAAEENPFFKVFWKRMAIMGAAMVGYTLATILLSKVLEPAVLGGIASVLVYVLLHYALNALVKAFRFRRAKELKVQLDEIMAAKEKNEQLRAANPELPKPQKAPWICHSCGEENEGRVAYCIFCNTSREWSLEQQKLVK